MAEETINELVRDIHGSVQNSSTTTKTTQELVKEIRDAVADGVISEQEVRDLIIDNAPEQLNTFKEVSQRLAHSGIQTTESGIMVTPYLDQIAVPNINSVIIKGATIQNSYSGINILDINNAEFAVVYSGQLYINGYQNSTASASNDCRVTFAKGHKDAGLAVCLGRLSAGDYSLWPSSNRTNWSIYTTTAVPSDGAPVARTALVSSYTAGNLFTAPGDVYVWACWNGSGTGSRNFGILQLVNGAAQPASDVLSWVAEPYTGGAPSPSVNYPQSINGALGFDAYDQVTGLYSSTMVVGQDSYYYAVAVTDSNNNVKHYGTTEKIPTLYYGDTLDLVTGTLTRRSAVIQSYNGEEIGSPWMSSIDIYKENTTPTIGAKVVYTLAEPIVSTVSVSDDISVIDDTHPTISSSCGFDLAYQEDESRYRNKFDIIVKASGVNFQSIANLGETIIQGMAYPLTLVNQLPANLDYKDFVNQTIKLIFADETMGEGLYSYSIKECIYSKLYNIIVMDATMEGYSIGQTIMFEADFYGLRYSFVYRALNGTLTITQLAPKRIALQLTATTDQTTGDVVYEGTNDVLPVLTQEQIGTIEAVDLSIGNNYVHTKINSVKQIDTKLYSIDLGSYYGYDRDSVANITATIDSSGTNNQVFYLRFTVPAMVADTNITSGRYFMVGDALYLATSDIESGGAITPGTNCTLTNLAEALNAINA